MDLSLTLPLFLAYHLGVIFLDVRNGTDLVTGELLDLAEGSKPMYLLLTAAIGVVFGGGFAWCGRGEAFRTSKFVQVAVEGAVYAFVMRLLGSYVVAKLAEGSGAGDPAFGAWLGSPPWALAASAASSGSAPGPFVGLIMSLGAGFYEELTFRVVLFGAGASALVRIVTGEKLFFVSRQGALLSAKAFFLAVGWACVSSLVFSGAHYVGAMADAFAWQSFVFRAVLGLWLALVYALRGFATAVWTHTLYDVWVLVL